MVLGRDWVDLATEVQDHQPDEAERLRAGGGCNVMHGIARHALSFDPNQAMMRADAKNRRVNP
jgi:hypothetical protein